MLFALLFPGMWVFQIVRSLHYEIVRDKLAWQGRDAAASGEGKPRAFAGFPGDAEAAKAAPGSAGKTFYRVWCHDLPTHAAGEPEYKIAIGARTFSGSCGDAQAAATPLTGPSPGERFVYFVFLSKLKSDADWNNAELRPNLIILNWEDMGGFLRHSFSLGSLILSLAASAFPVFGGLYLRANFRRVFAFPVVRRPDRAFALRYGGLALAACAAYAFPWFHNSVLLYFSLLGLAALAFRHVFLAPEPGPRPETPRLRSIHVTLLAAILAGSLWVRAHKSDWGFPLLLHTDEYAVTTFPPQMAATNSLNPIDFERPNHASIYLNSILYGVASHARFHAPLPETFDAHQPFYYRLSRLAVAVMGTLLVLAAFLVGAEFHPRFGVFAALLFAVYCQFVEHSHYVTPDVDQTLLLMGVVLFSIRYLKAPSLTNLLYACACAAVASSEKFTGLLSMGGVAATLALAHRGDRDALLLNLARAACIYVFVLFVTAPYLFIKPHLVLLSLISESRPTHLGSDGLGFSGNLLFYIRTYANYTSLLLAGFTALGAKAMARHGKLAQPLLLGLLYWIILSGLPLHWERWGIPMVVTPLLLAAYGMHALWEGWERFAGKAGFAARVATGAAAAALTFVAVFNLAIKNLPILSNLEAVDTRILSQVPMQDAGVAPGNSLSDQYTPFSPTWKRGFDFISSYRDADGMRGKDYAVVSSNMYQRYFNEEARYGQEVRFYQDLFTHPLVLSVKPELMAERFAIFNDAAILARAPAGIRSYWTGRFRVGPEIRVYKVSDGKAAQHG